MKVQESRVSLWNGCCQEVGDISHSTSYLEGGKAVQLALERHGFELCVHLDADRLERYSPAL